MIDTGRVDPSRPIDLAAICNSKAYKIDRNGKQFGVNLVGAQNECMAYTRTDWIKRYKLYARVQCQKIGTLVFPPIHVSILCVLRLPLSQVRSSMDQCCICAISFESTLKTDPSPEIDIDIDIHFTSLRTQTSEGMDRFAARVNLEVQWASEQTIAAVERNGGVITTAYFDIFCVNALSDPKRYFSLGHPVRRTSVCL